MDDYTDATYGERIADIYDERYRDAFAEDTAAAVPFLKDLAGDGPALELGIGPVGSRFRSRVRVSRSTGSTRRRPCSPS
jgi:hypothetical protein